MCTSAGQPTGGGGGQLERFSLGHTLLGPQKSIYSNRTVKSFIKAVIILWGGPTFISCPEPLKFSIGGPVYHYSDLLQSQCIQ